MNQARKTGDSARNDAVHTRGNVRQRMVESATQVLARRGLHATAFSEVLALTNTSRGSIYHHFPRGKTELIEAVLESVSARVDAELQSLHGQAAHAVLDGVIDVWRQWLVRGDCDVGCPVVAVTVAADSNRLMQHCQAAFDQWTATMASALRAAGVKEPRATSFATLLLAAIQGGLLLARAQGRIEPFDTVAAGLRTQGTLLAG